MMYLEGRVLLLKSFTHDDTVGRETRESFLPVEEGSPFPGASALGEE